MAGTAFLPWEEWLGKLLHPLYVAVRRWSFQRERQKLLTASRDWPETQGSVRQINADFSMPREEIVYSYSNSQDYFSGSSWRWFDLSNARPIRVDDKVILRYDPRNPESSVVVDL
jgi:hypothetical protein